MPHPFQLWQEAASFAEIANSATGLLGLGFPPERLAKFINKQKSELEGRSVPQWLEIDKDSFAGTVKGMPTREDITLPIQEQLIVELYSR